jgi:hypothetical protein
MLTRHDDGPAIRRQGDSSRRRQPFSFLRYSGWRPRRRLSRPPPCCAGPADTPNAIAVNTRPKHRGRVTLLIVLPSLILRASMADATSMLGSKQSVTHRTAVMTCRPTYRHFRCVYFTSKSISIGVDAPFPILLALSLRSSLTSCCQRVDLAERCLTPR